MCVIISSTLILPSMYWSTMPGSWLRPFTPPNAVPRQTRPVTSWKGRVAISWPAPATPMIDGLAPTFMTALECGAHELHVADAFERVIHAAVSHVDDHLLNRLVVLLGIHEIGGAELRAPSQTCRD